MAQRRAHAGPRRGRRVRYLLAGVTFATVLAVVAGILLRQSDPSSADSTRDAGTAAVGAADQAKAALPTADDLLDETSIRQLGPAHRWRVDRTDDNTSGDGLNSVCQQDRFADPDGFAALVRTFRAVDEPGRRAVQTVEVSKSPRHALGAFRTTLRWFAGCTAGRLQLLHAHRVGQVGDEADVLTLRIWRKPVTTMSIALARTGSLTTSTVTTTVGGTPPDAGRLTRALAQSVEKLCARAGTSGCVGRPTHRAVPPPPSGEEPGILAVADLPPVGRIDKPWVGTRAGRARPTSSADTCDRAAFRKSGAVRARTRTFLVPQAKLPARFGLSETYGVFRSGKAAAGFLAGVRGSVAGCEERDLATTVGAERRQTGGSPRMDASAWDLTTEVSEQEKVRFRLGFVQVGRMVAQLVFTPSARDDMSQEGFDALLTRAGDRLRELR